MTMMMKGVAYSFLTRVQRSRRMLEYWTNAPMSKIHVGRYSNSRSCLSSSPIDELDQLVDQVLYNPESILLQDESISKENSDDERLNDDGSGKKNTWVKIDWATTIDRNDKPVISNPSPVETFLIDSSDNNHDPRMVYVKRDDQLRLPGSQISGNKARKFWALNAMNTSEFPECIVSYGGPQSNAMVALAAVVHHFQNIQQQQQQQQQDDTTESIRHRFVYYTKRLPKFLRTNPSGNLFRAQALGMELIELDHQTYKDWFGGSWGGGHDRPPLALEPPAANSVWIPQGGACGAALAGARRLAREVVDDWNEIILRRRGCSVPEDLSSTTTEPLTVCLPGGTCSTAAILHQEIKQLLEKRQQSNNNTALDIKVVVIPCVGDESYSKRQMMALNAQLGKDVEDIPTILAPIPSGNQYREKNPHVKNQYFSFGEPALEILNTYRAMMDEHDLVLDLLYGAPSWTILKRHLSAKRRSTKNDDSTKFDPHYPFAGRSVMYIHSGGLEGINTQLLRYKYKGLIDKDEIQMPGKG